MDFSFDETQEAIRDLAKQILGDVVTDDSMRDLEREGQWLHRVAWDALAKAQLLPIALPESVGGGGLGIIELGLLAHQVGRTAAPVPVVPTLVSAALPIAQCGDAAQHERFLPGVADGTRLLTAALSDAGSRDARRPATTATPNGEGFRLSGTKLAVPYADVADTVLVPAVLPSGETAVFCVSFTAAGLTRRAEIGTSDEPLATLTLADVSVGLGERLGTDDTAPAVLGRIIAQTEAATCALALGLAERALFMTASYTGERVQFGRPISAFQAVKQRVGDMYIDVQCMKVTTWQALWRLSAGLPAEREVAIARFWACEGGHRVVAGAQHIHGGMGFDRDYPLYRYFLAMKQLEFTLGAASAQVARIGDIVATSA